MTSKKKLKEEREVEFIMLEHELLQEAIDFLKENPLPSTSSPLPLFPAMSDPDTAEETNESEED